MRVGVMRLCMVPVMLLPQSAVKPLRTLLAATPPAYSRKCKFLVILLAAVCAVSEQIAAQTGSAAPAIAPQDLFSRLAPSVYVVEGLNETGDVVSLASAVGVGKSELLTNKHAVTDSASLRIKQGVKVWHATVEKLDEAADLCLLSVDDLNDPILPTIRNSGSIKIGERVFAIGAPFGLELSLSDGLVAALRHDGDVTLVQTTAPISKGSSGGGLFDSQGQLVGITTFYLAGGQNLNFAIAAERMFALRQERAEGTARAWAAVAADIAGNAQSVAGLESPPSDLGQLNEWGERMRPRLKILMRERGKAARAYVESLRLNPNDSAVWAKLGTLYAWLEELQKMKAAFGEALRLRPDDVSILTSFGEGYDHLGEHSQAVQAFRDAVRLQPTNADLWVSLANVLGRTDNKEASKALQQAEQLRPSSAQVWLRIGMQYQFLNRYSNAETAFQEAIELEPNNASNWFLLGNLYGLRHNERKFRDAYEHLRRIDPSKADKLQSAWR